MLDDPRIDVNCRDGTDVAPLVVAVCRGNIPLVKTLLARNDVARDPDDNKGNTPLLLAAWLGNLPLLGIFLNFPWINIWHRNHKRETALALAAQEGHVDVVKRFLNPRLGATAYVLEDAVTAVNSGGAERWYFNGDIWFRRGNSALEAASSREEEIVELISHALKECGL